MKDHFFSDKTDASEAANYVFNQTRISIPIDQSIIRKFVKMQLATEGMYAATFQPTQLVGSLGVTVMAMSPEHKAMLEQMREEAIEEENVQREMNHLRVQKAAPKRPSQRRSISVYPSPEQSPEPTSSLSDVEDTEAEFSIPTPSAGRKRRRSSPDEPGKGNKRAKYVTLSRTLSIHTYTLYFRSGTVLTTVDPTESLPSPALSREGSTDSTFNYWASSSEDLSETLQSSNTPPQQLNSRKRCLSDADADPAPPKRPRGFAVGPRFHTVSDPLPPPSNCLQTQTRPSDSEIFDSLYDPSIFEMPGPVTSHTLDSNEPLDISFFNWTSGESTDYQFLSLSNRIASLAPSPISLHYLDLPASELSSLTAPGFDVMGNNSPTDTLDDFLQQFSQGSQLLPTLPSSDPVMQGFATPHSMPKTPAQTMANPMEDWSQGMFMNQSDPKISSASEPGFVEFGNMISGSSSTMLGLSSALSPDEIIAQSEAAIRRAKLQKMESLRAELAALEQDTTA